MDVSRLGVVMDEQCNRRNDSAPDDYHDSKSWSTITMNNHRENPPTPLFDELIATLKSTGKLPKFALSQSIRFEFHLCSVGSAVPNELQVDGEQWRVDLIPEDGRGDEMRVLEKNWGRAKLVEFLRLWADHVVAYDAMLKARHEAWEESGNGREFEFLDEIEPGSECSAASVAKHKRAQSAPSVVDAERDWPEWEEGEEQRRNEFVASVERGEKRWSDWQFPVSVCPACQAAVATETAEQSP